MSAGSHKLAFENALVRVLDGHVLRVEPKF